MWQFFYTQVLLKFEYLSLGCGVIYLKSIVFDIELLKGNNKEFTFIYLR